MVATCGITVTPVVNKAPCFSEATHAVKRNET